MAMDKEREALVNLLIRLKNQIPSECMINNPEVDELHQETQRFIDVLSEQTRTSQVSYSLVTPAVDTSAPRVVIENALTAQPQPAESVVVPREPTEEMIESALAVLDDDFKSWDKAEIVSIYKAFLAAAKEPRK